MSHLYLTLALQLKGRLCIALLFGRLTLHRALLDLVIVVKIRLLGRDCGVTVLRPVSVLARRFGLLDGSKQLLAL